MVPWWVALPLVVGLAVLLHALVRLGEARHNARGMIEGGSRAITDGQKRVKEGRHLLFRSTLSLAFFTIVALVVVVVGLLLYAQR